MVSTLPFFLGWQIPNLTYVYVHACVIACLHASVEVPLSPPPLLNLSSSSSSPSSLNFAAELRVEITRAVVRGIQTDRARNIHVCQISLGESERDSVFRGIQRRQFEAALCNVLKPEDIEVCVC